jgi:transposase
VSTSAGYLFRGARYAGHGREAVSLQDTIPGVAGRPHEMIVAETGTDLTRLPSADHLGSWARVAPGNHESTGKCMSA